MVVLGASGHPLLGGTDIDQALKKKLEYTGQLSLLLQTKEGLTAARPSVSLADGTVVDIDTVNATLRDGRFVMDSLISVNRALHSPQRRFGSEATAQTIFTTGRSVDQEPRQLAVVTHVWQCDWNQLADNVDGIILFGGPTRSPYFTDVLSTQFGSDKVKNAWDVLPTIAATPDLDLVGISMGACYSYEETYSPLYVNRLPVKVDLEDLETGQKVEYKPYELLGDARKLFEEYVSQGALSRWTALASSSLPRKTIQLTVMLPNGVVEQRAFADEQIDCRLMASTLDLVVDRFGRVGVEQRSRYTRAKRTLVFNDTQWQTDNQKAAIGKLLAQQERYAERQKARGNGRFVTRSPFLGDYETSP